MKTIKMRIMLAMFDQDFADATAEMVNSIPETEIVGSTTDGSEVLRLASELNPNILLLTQEIPGGDSFAITEHLRISQPRLGVFLIGTTCEPGCIQRAMLAGARELLAAPLDRDELAAILEEHRELQLVSGAPTALPTAPAPAQPARSPRIIVVAGASGGVGKTTTAANLATWLAEKQGERVALVDANVRYGDIASAMGLESERDISDLVVPNPEEIDLRMISGVLTRHRSGVEVLTAPPSPDDASMITPAMLGQIVGELASAYDRVIVDTSAGITELDRAALELADKVVVVFTLAMNSLKNTSLLMREVRLHRWGGGEPVLLANRIDNSGGVTLTEVEKQLNLNVTVCLPEDRKTAAQATNKGVPFVIDRKNTAIAGSIGKLAAALTVKPARKKGEDASGGGFFRRLRARKEDAA